ncbi:MAG: heavy metal-associated domain-containing protein [Maribacter sp.]
MKFRLLILIPVFFGISSMTIAQEVPASTSNVTQHIMSTAILEIEGMACQEGCADKISSNLMETDGIASAYVSYADKRAVISYDPSLVSIDAIESIIINTKVKNYAYTVNKVTIQE